MSCGLVHGSGISPTSIATARVERVEQERRADCRRARRRSGPGSPTPASGIRARRGDLDVDDREQDRQPAAALEHDGRASSCRDGRTPRCRPRSRARRRARSSSTATCSSAVRAPAAATSSPSASSARRAPTSSTDAELGRQRQREQVERRIPDRRELGERGGHGRGSTRARARRAAPTCRGRRTAARGVAAAPCAVTSYILRGVAPARDVLGLEPLGQPVERRLRRPGGSPCATASAARTPRRW